MSRNLNRVATTTAGSGYEDVRYEEVDKNKQTALDEVDKTYGDMIGDVDSYYDKQIQATEDWGKKQQQIQQEQTDFAIEQIEQQKQQAEKDYMKEQSGAYVDWQKQSAQHGVNAEKMATAGMTGTGYSESSRVSMYNTYQNRVATARESFNQATTNYNNAITQARLQNNAALAQIAAETYEKQLALALEGFQYKNTLVLQQAEQKRQVESEYYSRWQDVLKQINTEKAMAEDVRQFNEKMAEEQRQFNDSLAWEKEQAGGSSNGVYFEDNSGLEKSEDNGIKAGALANAANGAFLSNPNSQEEVDMDSVYELGYGNLTPEQAYALVQLGLVETYVKNGKLYFRKKGQTQGN